MNKQKTYNLILDYLITDKKHQEKLFEEPTLIHVYGEPIPVILFHDRDVTVICKAKQGAIGLIPTSNYWNVIKFLWKNRKNEYNEPIHITWDQIYFKITPAKVIKRLVREYESEIVRELSREAEDGAS
jgi:hypothetical protein